MPDLPLRRPRGLPNRKPLARRMAWIIWYHSTRTRLRLILTPIIVFERVGKRYKLHRDRPRSFREVFVRRRLAGRPVIAEPDTLWALRDASFEIEPGET